jgi:DNA-binding transcriptional ArsR family regulator
MRTKVAARGAIPMETLERVAAALRVLAHPHRLKMVELLGAHELTVGELADRMDLPQAACSQHLNLMRAHGLLRARREGRTVLYEVANASARNVIQCIREHEMT